MKKIVVVGSLNMDLVINTPRVPKLGETIIGSNFITVPGGKGANQAVAIAKLGGDISMIGCVGEDIFGYNLLDNLKANKVKAENVQVLKGVSTGVAVITISGSDNFIILDSGANFKINCKMINAIKEVIIDSDMILVQLEIPLEVVQYVIDLAFANNVKIILNPAPAAGQLSDQILSKVDWLIPNESECEIITGMTIKSVNDAKSAVGLLRKRGIRNTIITMGKNGAVYNNGDKILHKPVPEVKAVDTTAAGDSFIGALAVSLTEGNNIDEAVEFGNKAGMLTVMKLGAQSSLPLRQEVESLNMNIKS
jgi:ribokinase